jgi:hypothetical protein
VKKPRRLKGIRIKVPARKLDKVPPKPLPSLSTKPRHRRWWQAAKWAGMVVPLLGIVSTLDQLWGPVWPMPPEISFSATSEKNLAAEPFLVKNPAIAHLG